MEELEQELRKCETIVQRVHNKEKYGLHPNSMPNDAVLRPNPEIDSRPEIIQGKTASQIYAQLEAVLGKGRNPFFRDGERIKFSSNFGRLQDTTQVWTTPGRVEQNNRLTHSLRVADISRSICRFLGLNEDLAEAIALGHDLGHPPLGHTGENILTDLSKEDPELYKIVGYFRHNLQSLRVVDILAARSGAQSGTGLNLTLPVRDGIVFHDGEVDDINGLTPDEQGCTEERILQYVHGRLYKLEKTHVVPGTLEAIVVRLADVIAYIGGDFEDAIALGLLKRNHLPKDIFDRFGNIDKNIITALVADLIINSSPDDKIIKYSRETAELLVKFKRFMYERVYNVANSWAEGHSKELPPGLASHPFFKEWNSGEVKILVKKLLDKFIRDIENCRFDSSIYKKFIDKMDPEYIRRSHSQLIARDYIASMTRREFMDALQTIKKSGQMALQL